MINRISRADLTDKVIARFWNKVEVKGEDDCWEWRASITTEGYGNINIGGVICKAHRFSWILHNGDIPEYDSSHGLCVCHKCDNPKCVNPVHLWLGTNQENMRDRERKGRTAIPDNRGELHGNSKLTEEQVIAIREKYSPEVYSQQMLAVEYGVAHQTISKIISRKLWNCSDVSL